MHHNRVTLILDWHKYRESDPKDYDVTALSVGKKCLHNSTYKRFGTCTDVGWTTSTEAQLSSCRLKVEHKINETPKSILPPHLFESAIFDRANGQQKKDYNSILARNDPNRNKIDLNSTYKIDYQPPYDCHKNTNGTDDQPDHTPNFKKHCSQFADTADYRRMGRNTWQDDAGA